MSEKILLVSQTCELCAYWRAASALQRDAIPSNENPAKRFSFEAPPRGALLVLSQLILLDALRRQHPLHDLPDGLRQRYRLAPGDEIPLAVQ